MPAPKDAEFRRRSLTTRSTVGFARWTAQLPSAGRLALTPYTRVTR